MLACLVDCAMPLRFLEKETSRKNGGSTSCGDAGSGAAPAVWMVATGGLGVAGPRPARDLRLLRGEDAPLFLMSVGPLGDSRSIHILRWMHSRQLYRDLPTVTC